MTLFVDTQPSTCTTQDVLGLLKAGRWAKSAFRQEKTWSVKQVDAWFTVLAQGWSPGVLPIWQADSAGAVDLQAFARSTWGPWTAATKIEAVVLDGTTRLEWLGWLTRDEKNDAEVSSAQEPVWWRTYRWFLDEAGRIRRQPKDQPMASRALRLEALWRDDVWQEELDRLTHKALADLGQARASHTGLLSAEKDKARHDAERPSQENGGWSLWTARREAVQKVAWTVLAWKGEPDSVRETYRRWVLATLNTPRAAQALHDLHDNNAIDSTASILSDTSAQRKTAVS